MCNSLKVRSGVPGAVLVIQNKDFLETGHELNAGRMWLGSAETNFMRTQNGKSLIRLNVVAL